MYYFAKNIKNRKQLSYIKSKKEILYEIRGICLYQKPKEDKTRANNAGKKIYHFK